MEALGPITRVAHLDAGLSLVLPAWGVRLRMRDPPGAWRYFFVGHPDFSRARAPWHYVERMGAAYRLEADGRLLTVITRARGPLTEARMVLEHRA